MWAQRPQKSSPGRLAASQRGRSVSRMGGRGVSQGCKKKQTQIVKNLENENGDGKVMAREKNLGGDGIL